MTEVELGRCISDWLRSEGWDVYQEVSAGYGGARADIVARKKRLIWVIELKTSMSLKLLDQIIPYREFAHFISIGYISKHGRLSGIRNRNVMNYLNCSLGLGCFGVEPGSDYQASYVREYISPRHYRPRNPDAINKGLCPEHKNTTDAGSNKGGYHTPFRGTVNTLINYVSCVPGCTIKEAIDSINHHYASDATAKACLSKFIGTDVIRDIVFDETVRPYKLYLKKDFIIGSTKVENN